MLTCGGSCYAENIDVIGTEDATTCHILIIRHSGQCTAGLVHWLLVLSYVYSKQPIFGLTQEWLRELSFYRLECGVHDRLYIYHLCGIFYFPWHRHQIEGTNGFYCLIRKTQRYTVSNVESQIFTPNNVPGPGIEPLSAA